jgi:hypothetical protein
MSKFELPDPDRRELKYGEFLSATAGDELHREYSELLEMVPSLQDVVRRGYPMPDGEPELYISTEDKIVVECRDYRNRVVLSTGFLRSTLDICRVSDPILRRAGHHMAFGELTIAKLYVLWATAHEVFHLIRRHDLAETHFGAIRETKQALEYDADQCAVAAVFRVVQRCKTHLSARRCKVAVLVGLFWVLRSEADKSVEFGGTDSHAHFAGRLVDIGTKLSMLHGQRDPADVTLSRPETRADDKALREVLKRLEGTYLRSSIGGAAELETSRLAMYAYQNREGALVIDRMRKWDEISRFIVDISTLPRALVPNDERIAFLGDRGVSVPFGSASGGA